MLRLLLYRDMVVMFSVVGNEIESQSSKHDLVFHFVLIPLERCKSVCALLPVRYYSRFLAFYEATNWEWQLLFLLKSWSCLLLVAGVAKYFLYRWIEGLRYILILVFLFMIRSIFRLQAFLIWVKNHFSKFYLTNFCYIPPPKKKP